MAIRQIRYSGDDILKKVTKPIDIIDDKIKELANDMLDTLYKNDGIGLAACQVGFLKRMLVYDVDYVKEKGEKNPHVLINPVITSKSKKMVTTEEGCLSFPDIFGYVDRSQKVTVEALDINGKKIKITAKDIEAVVIQHETDHLDGIVFIDKAYNIHKYNPDDDKEKENVKENDKKKQKNKKKNKLNKKK